MAVALICASWQKLSDIAVENAATEEEQHDREGQLERQDEQDDHEGQQNDIAVIGTEL